MSCRVFSFPFALEVALVSRSRGSRKKEEGKEIKKKKKKKERKIYKTTEFSHLRSRQQPGSMKEVADVFFSRTIPAYLSPFSLSSSSLSLSLSLSLSFSSACSSSPVREKRRRLRSAGETLFNVVKQINDESRRDRVFENLC